MLIFIVSVLIASIAVHRGNWIGAWWKTLYWMMPFLLFYTLTLSVKNRFIERITLGAFHIAMFLTSVPAIVMYLQTHRRSNVIYGDANSLAFMVELILPICICLTLYYIKNNSNTFGKISFIANDIIGVVGLCTTESRGAFCGIIIGLVLLIFIYGFKKYNFIRMLLVFSCVVLTFFVGSYIFQEQIHKSFSRSYDHERVLLLKSSYAMWQDHKIFGVGLENWSTEYHTKYMLPEAKEPNLEHPHNIYSYYFATTGLVGGFAFAIMLLGIAVFFAMHIGISSIGEICAAAMLWVAMIVMIHGFFDVVILSKDMARLFYGFMGIACAVIHRCRKEGKISD